MGNKSNNFTEIPNPYQTIEIGMHRGNIAPNNQFNDYLIKHIMSKTAFVDFIGHLPESTRCTSLKNLNIANGKSPRHDLRLARSVNKELQRIFVPVADDFYKTHLDFIMGVYMVVGLAYCSVTKRDKSSAKSFLCTKNPSVIEIVCNQYNLDYPYSGVDKYEDRFHVTPEEIEGNYLRCVKLEISKGKLNLKAVTVYPHSKATVMSPMFVIGFYSDAVHNALSKGTFEVTFKHNGATHKIVTSLNENVLAQRSRMDPQYVVGASYVTTDIGLIRLLDLNSQRGVIIRLFDIVSLRRLS